MERLKENPHVPDNLARLAQSSTAKNTQIEIARQTQVERKAQEFVILEPVVIEDNPGFFGKALDWIEEEAKVLARSKPVRIGAAVVLAAIPISCRGGGEPTPTVTSTVTPTRPTIETPTRETPMSTPTLTKTPTPEPTATPTRKIKLTATPVPTRTESPTPTVTPTREPTATPTPTIEVTATPVPVPTETSTPTVTPETSPVPPVPTETPTPTVTPETSPVPETTKEILEQIKNEFKVEILDSEDKPALWLSPEIARAFYENFKKIPFAWLLCPQINLRSLPATFFPLLDEHYNQIAGKPSLVFDIPDNLRLDDPYPLFIESEDTKVAKTNRERFNDVFLRAYMATIVEPWGMFQENPYLSSFAQITGWKFEEGKGWVNPWASLNDEGEVVVEKWRLNSREVTTTFFDGNNPPPSLRIPPNRINHAVEGMFAKFFWPESRQIPEEEGGFTKKELRYFENVLNILFSLPQDPNEAREILRTVTPEKLLEGIVLP